MCIDLISCSVIHLLGNYISQEGIDDQNDDEIGFVELHASDKDESADDMLEESAPSITFPGERKGLGFDESDEFETTSESQAESESGSESESEMTPYYSMTQLSSYADKLTPTASPLATSKDAEDYAPASNKEGTGRYVLINGNASVRSSTAESEPLDEQSDTSNTVTDHASLSDSQHHITESEAEEEEQGNADANSQIEKVTNDVVPKSEDEFERDSEDGLEKESEYESELEIKQTSGQESEQVSEYEPEPESEQIE
ncbi:hypothetical protein G6F42_025071 [Rhizopus arrhizus]|nr:hypothetical protein G6F42_025071 [Rhizopus arrhizus]